MEILEEIDAAMRHEWFLRITDRPISETIIYMPLMEQ